MKASTSPRDYSLIAPVYDQVFNRFLNQGHKRIGRLLKAKKMLPTFKVLEVGIGSGLSLDYLPDRIKFTGVDVNEKMLSLAKIKADKLERKNVTLSIMNAEKLKLKANSFDLVMAASVLTAVEDPGKAMKEMIRVTKPGGQIAIIANLRTKSKTSSMLKRLDPVTKKYLGFRMDLEADYFKQFPEIKLVKREEVNQVMGVSLSSFLLFKKL